MSTTGPWNPLEDKLRSVDERISAIDKRIDAVVRGNADFRASPIAGKFPGFKRMIYRLVNSSFTKQREQNERMADLMREIQAALRDQQEVLRVLQTHEIATSQAMEEQLAEETRSVGVAAVKLRVTGLLRVLNSAAQLRWPERVLIYSLVYGLKPRRMLEIGTAQGGSALIACGAMDDTGFGQLYCVDLKFQVAAEHWAALRHRATFVEGPSPESLGEAARLAGGGFDLAFIDGDHTYDGLLRDIRGVLPYMEDRAHLLFHDSHHADVRIALDHALAEHPQLVDCGELSTEQTVVQVPDWGTNLWGGLRLLRFQRDRA